MEGTSREYCRFCAQLKDCYELIDLSLNQTLLVEIQQKLLQFNGLRIDFSPQNTLPKSVCLPCFNSVDDSDSFLGKLVKSQTELKKIYSNEGKVVKVKLEVSRDLNSDSDEDGDTWSGYTWVCRYCEKTFKEVEFLRGHFQTVHNVCSGFCCVDCSKRLDTYEIFVKHVRRHREHLRLYCHHCNKKLETDEESNTHMKVHESDTKCKRCGVIFPSKKEFKRHSSMYRPSKLRMEQKVKKLRSAAHVTPLPKVELSKVTNKSWDGYPWKCQVCGMVCYDIHSLRGHTKEMHKKCFAMACVDCTKATSTYIEFVAHVRQHRPFLKQYCLYCNYDFTDGDPDTVHLAQHFIGIQRICHGCGEIFPDQEELDRHIQTYKPVESKRMPHMARERPITVSDRTCNVCGKVTSTIGSLKKHKLLHKERSRDFVCPTCGKAFFENGAMVAHKRIHTGEKPEICEICQKTFRNMSQLRMHVKTHTDGKKVKCDFCPKLFRTKKQQLEHSLVHTNTMRFRCNYCDKHFKYKCNLQTHQNQHTGERPYRCSECNMGFASWSNCNKHMIRRHGITLAKTKLTPLGKLPIDRRTGEVNTLNNFEATKQWTQDILVPKKKKTDQNPEQNR